MSSTNCSRRRSKGEASSLVASLLPSDWFTRRSRYEIVDLGFDTPCWRWLMSTSCGGYGQIVVRLEGGRSVGGRAHRVIWELMRGSVPAGMELDHLCNRPICVNPAHLEPVTALENAARKYQRGYVPAGRPNFAGRKLTPDQVVEIRGSSESQRELSRRFGINQASISRIRNGRRYREIEA